MMARCALLEFGGQACGTLVEYGIIVRKMRYAVDVLVGIEKIAIARMAKSLVPK
jgi:hypothetical protein